MTKETAKDYLPLVQALAQGKTIQWQSIEGWIDAPGPIAFDADPSCYRIKPEPRRWWLVWDGQGLPRIWSDPPMQGHPGMTVVEVVEVMK